MSMKRKKFEKKEKQRPKFESILNNWYRSLVIENNNQLIKCYTEEFSCVPESSRK